MKRLGLVYPVLGILFAGCSSSSGSASATHGAPAAVPGAAQSATASAAENAASAAQSVGESAAKKAAAMDEQAAIAKAKGASAVSILPADPKAAQPPSGTIAEYLTGVMGAPEYGEVVAKMATCQKHADHVCVELAAEPCKRFVENDMDFCEGLYINLWIDVTETPPVLERGKGGSGQSVTSQADIQREFDMAP